jgi:serine/threonine protein kinase
MITQINKEEFLNKIIQTYNITTINISDIKLKQRIGNGGQAEVIKGEYNGKTVAIKIIKKFEPNCFEREIAILSNIHHRNIPKFYGLVTTDTILAIVMEYINGGTLAQLELNKLHDSDKYLIVTQLADAIEYLHSCKLIHRDLKPENIMLSRHCQVFLIDFGISKILSEDKIYTETMAKGTLLYMAPENLDASCYTSEENIVSMISTKVDVWSFGCIISYIFSGFKPWLNKYNEDVISNLLFDKDLFPVPSNLEGKVVFDVVQRCTEVEAESRADIFEVQEMLKPYRNDKFIEKLEKKYIEKNI